MLAPQILAGLSCSTVICFGGLLKDERVYAVLIKATEKLIESLEQNTIQQAVEMADMLHNLPIVIVENHFAIPKRFWFRIEVHPECWIPMILHSGCMTFPAQSLDNCMQNIPFHSREKGYFYAFANRISSMRALENAPSMRSVSVCTPPVGRIGIVCV